MLARSTQAYGPQQVASSHLTYQDYIRALDRQLIRLSAWKSHSCNDEWSSLVKKQLFEPGQQA